MAIVDRSATLKRGALTLNSRKLANISSVERARGVKYWLVALDFRLTW
jgi:hypothetical protein